METETKIEAEAELKNPDVGQDSEAEKSNHQSTNGTHSEMSQETYVNLKDFVVVDELHMSCDSESDSDDSIESGSEDIPEPVGDKSNPVTTEGNQVVGTVPSDKGSTTSKYVRHPDCSYTLDELNTISQQLRGKKNRNTFVYSVYVKGADPQEKMKSLLTKERNKPRKHLRKITKLYLPKIKRRDFYMQAMKGTNPAVLMMRYLSKPAAQQWLLRNRFQLTNDKLLSMLFEHKGDNNEASKPRTLKEWFNIFLRETYTSERPSLSGHFSSVQVKSVEEAIEKVKRLVLSGAVIKANCSGVNINSDVAPAEQFKQTDAGESQKSGGNINNSQKKESVYNRGFGSKAKSKRNHRFQQLNEEQLKEYNSWLERGLSHFDALTIALKFPRGWAKKGVNKGSGAGKPTNQRNTQAKSNSNRFLNAQLQKNNLNSGLIGPGTQPAVQPSWNAAQPPSLPVMRAPRLTQSNCSGPVQSQTLPAVPGQPAPPPGMMAPLLNPITCSGPMAQPPPGMPPLGNFAQPAFMISPMPNPNQPTVPQPPPGMPPWGNVARPPFPHGTASVPMGTPPPLHASSVPMGMPPPPLHASSVPMGMPPPLHLQNTSTYQGVPPPHVGSLHPHLPINDACGNGVLNGPFIPHQIIPQVPPVIPPLAAAGPPVPPTGGRVPQKSSFVEGPITRPMEITGAHEPPGPASFPSADSLRLYIVPSKYPTELLSEEQSDLIGNSIRVAISGIEDDRMKPVFTSTFHNGKYEVICKNQLARKWFHKYVKSIYPVVALKIIPAEEAKIKASAVLPLCKNDDNDKIIKFIAAQNTGLNVAQWKIVKRSDDGENTSLCLLVDQKSAEVLKNCGEINFKMGSGAVVIVDELAKQLASGKAKTNDAVGASVTGKRAPAASTSFGGLGKEQAPLSQAEHNPRITNIESRKASDVSCAVGGPGYTQGTVPQGEAKLAKPTKSLQSDSKEGAELARRDQSVASSKPHLDRLKPIVGIRRRNTVESSSSSYVEPPGMLRRDTAANNMSTGRISRYAQPSQRVPSPHQFNETMLNYRERPSRGKIGSNRRHSQEHSRSQYGEPPSKHSNEPRFLRKSYGDFLRPPQVVSSPQVVPSTQNKIFPERPEGNSGKKKSPSPDFDELLRSAKSRLNL